MPDLTPRDLAALRFIAEMRAVREDDLGVLLGRLAQRPVTTLRPEGTRTLLKRWTRQGLVMARRVLSGHPRVIELTPEGARVARMTVSPVAWVRMEHTMAVARCRLLLEGRNPGAVWTTERELIEQRLAEFPLEGRNGRKIPHLPDGLLTLPGAERPRAIEVELSRKMPRDVQRIMADLAESPRYGGVSYYVPESDPALIDFIRTAADAVPVFAARRRASVMNPNRDVPVRPADVEAVRRGMTGIAVRELPDDLASQLRLDTIMAGGAAS